MAAPPIRPGDQPMIELTPAEVGYLLMLLREARRKNESSRVRLTRRFQEKADLERIEIKDGLRVSIEEKLRDARRALPHEERDE